VNAPQIKDMAFNYLQSTKVDNETIIQRGEPVLIVAKSVHIIYMYNLATQKTTTLISYWGPSNAHLFQDQIRLIASILIWLLLPIWK